MAEAKLERPDLFKRFPTGLFGRRLAKVLLREAKKAQAGSNYQPNIAVIVRTKNDRKDLSIIVKHIEKERQNYKGRIDLIVVDTESSDGTLDVARQARADIVPVKQANFSYPKGMNLGMAKVKKDVVATFITVGHASEVINIGLGLGARHFADPEVVGVYADLVPNDNASFWERLFIFCSPNIYLRARAGARKKPRLHGGMMQASACFMRMTTWQKYPFDEAFAHGGEDLEWARRALDRKHILIFDPVVTVHHTHGLGFINLSRQLRYWLGAAMGPAEFDQKKYDRYRPDMADKG